MIMYGKDTSLETVKIVNPKDSKAYLIINSVDFKHGRDVLWDERSKGKIIEDAKPVIEKEKNVVENDIQPIVKDEKISIIEEEKPVISEETRPPKKQPRTQFVPDAPPVQEL